MEKREDIVIVTGARTPMGGLQGDLAESDASTLGSVVIKEVVRQAGISGDEIDEVLMGCVLPAGQGQAPARQAAKKAGISDSVGSTTINKMCGSGMKAAMLGHDLIMAGSAEVVVVGGMESMSKAPYLMLNARKGMRLGHGVLQDHMFLDGLEDAYDKGRLMGSFAESTARHYQFTREQQDSYAIESLKRAKRATSDGTFSKEIIPVKTKTRKGECLIEIDEQPQKADLGKVPLLKPAFAPDGTVTAANSSSISDGAAALVIMKGSEAQKRGITAIARIVGHSTHSQAPEWFTTAPIGAIEKLFSDIGWTKDVVDLFEINEAFAVVSMVAMKELALDHNKVNVNGGACALGHPVGASGARIIVTLINALRRSGGRKGIASLCIGGGEATAMAIEMCN